MGKLRWMDTMTNPKRTLKIRDEKFSPIGEFPTLPLLQAIDPNHIELYFAKDKAIMSMAAFPKCRMAMGFTECKKHQVNFNLFSCDTQQIPKCSFYKIVLPSFLTWVNTPS
jgi:hypothetical protein